MRESGEKRMQLLHSFFATLRGFRRRQQTRVFMIQLEQECHPFGVGFCRDWLETCPYVCRINGLIQSRMRFSEVRRHGNGIIEVGERSVGMCGTCIEYGLCGVFDCRPLFFGRSVRPRVVVAMIMA